MKKILLNALVLLLFVHIISCQSTFNTALPEPALPELIQSVKNSNNEYLQWYIEQGFNLDRQDENGKTILIHAITLNKPSAVKLLLDAGADVNKKDNRDFDVMFYAVNKNNIQIANLLLEAGYPIHLENESNAMNIIMAVDFKYLELLNLLIDKGKAKLDYPNLKEPKSVLVEAILESVDRQYINSLIARGALLNGVHRGRHHHRRSIMITYNPVIAAIMVYDKKLVRFLLSQGSAVDKVNGKEQTFDAAYYAVQMDAPELLELVLSIAKYVDANKKYHELLTDAARDCSKCIAILSNYGLNPDYYGDDEDKMTPLMLAAWKNNTLQIINLLNLGAQIDLQDKQGRTALFLAAGNGYLDSVKLLIEHGANAKLGTAKVKSPMENAIKSGHYLTADYLKHITNDKINIEPMIIAREKSLFFSDRNLESCREQVINGSNYEICIESNHSPKQRAYVFSVKSDGRKLFTKSLSPATGMHFRHFSIFRRSVTSDKVLVRIPEVKGMPNRYQYLVDQYYLLDSRPWKLEPVWAAPKCGYPCTESKVSIEPGKNEYIVKHYSQGTKTNDMKVLTFTISN